MPFNIHLALRQRSGLLQRSSRAIELVELLHFEQAADTLRRLGLLRQIIALQQLLVLGLEQRISSGRLSKDEESHGVGTMLLDCSRKNVSGLRWVGSTSRSRCDWN